MCHTLIWDVQYGKKRVKYDKAYYTNTPYDTSLMYTYAWCVHRDFLAGKLPIRTIIYGEGVSMHGSGQP